MKQKFLDTKRTSYGLDNEEQLVSMLRRSITQQVERRGMTVEGPSEEFRSFSTTDAEMLEMALELQQELKQNHLKRHIFSKLFDRFKQLLVSKTKLQKVMNEADAKIIFHNLDRRAQNNYAYMVCLWISRHWLFSPFITLVIVANTAVLAQDKYPITESTVEFYETLNLIFTVVFFMEMLIKMIGLGIKEYFRDKFNTFDCVVVVISTADVAITSVISTGGTGGNGAISALRAFRLLRVFKLAKTWKEFQDLLKTIANTLKDISNFSILLLLFIFTYTLLGLELFAGKVKFNENDEVDLANGSPPESTFDSFLKAFTSVFIVLANDGWTTIYFNHYRAVGEVVSTFFFISLLVIGQYILLNLFLAILLKNFDEVSINREVDKKERKHGLASRGIHWIKKKLGFVPNQVVPVKKQLSKMSSIGESEFDSEEGEGNRSLYLFAPDNKLRLFLQKLVVLPGFDYAILFFILISSVQLALENPLNDPDGQLNTVLNYIDITLTSIFVIEAFLKIIAFGLLLNGPESYLRSS